METKDLNLIPSGSMPIVHASQFDDMRHIRFNLKDDEEEYTLESGITLECHIKKVDGNVVTFAVENTETKYIDVYFPQQATACAGPNVGEIVIIDEDNFIIGTINFILEVERSPMLGGIESASDIHDLTEQIEVIVTQVIATDYYTKTEVDNLLNDKANISDLPDMSDYYTKTQVDTALADKADISDLPDMSDYYTKTQIDQKFIDIMPVNSASGSNANFNTSLALPLVALKAYINAQGGGGTPSAPVAITGFDTVVITQADGSMQTVETYTIQLGQTVYGGYIDKSTGKLVITLKEYDLSALTWTLSSVGASKFYALISDTVITGGTALCSIYQSGNDTAWSTQDNIININRNNNLNAIRISDSRFIGYTSADIQSALSGIKAYIELATPIETDITIPDITALVGEQNIFADSGDIELSFKQDIQNYVDSKISAANANRTLSMIRPITTEESKGDEDER